MSTEPALTFYDIASALPSRTFAANPWKTRLALNYKGIPYKTRWVQMPDITAVREQLGVPANRTHADGTPYHTLPVVEDHSTGKIVGDTFEIAQYLDNTYPSPDGKNLFRPLSTGLTAAHNAHIDGIFTKFAILCSRMPFDPSVQDEVTAIFAKRATTMAVDMNFGEEQRKAMIGSFEAALGELAKSYRHTGGTTDYFWLPKGTEEAQKQRGRQEVGPFLDGKDPVYADFIVGSWLKMFEASMPEADWQDVRSWHGGLWGRIVDALKPWSEMK
ncbi:Putative glutathione S-transferase, Thioredoxin-like superfamily [Septoria linicola]|uniref:Glutathione S-transferase, Thioredoxin-like superfamily n=1 Tax=Septoria linicola TaxID=215465 RepID=A0A9Q9EKB8_9PEZI|nr:Putative glutathione S-transferase, Thioredoxin-like superfamily [Septoria linicola]